MPKKWIAGALAAAMIPGNGASAAGGSSGGETPSLVELESFALPIIENDRVGGTLRLELVLQAADGTAATHAGEQLPVLRAALTAAGLEHARLYTSAFRAVDVEKLEHDLFEAAHAVDPGISRVLIVKVAASAGS